MTMSDIMFLCPALVLLQIFVEMKTSLVSLHFHIKARRVISSGTGRVETEIIVCPLNSLHSLPEKIVI